MNNADVWIHPRRSDYPEGVRKLHSNDKMIFLFFSDDNLGSSDIIPCFSRQE